MGFVYNRVMYAISSFELCMPFRVSFLNVICINVAFKHSKNYS